MQAQSHRSPDGLLLLTSEPTITIDATHPDGHDDWIIALEPGPWHTHPTDLNNTDSFITAILNDETKLALYKRNNQVLETVPITTSAWEYEDTHRPSMQSGDRIIYRTWSGGLIDEVLKRDIPAMIDRCFSPHDRDDAHAALELIESDEVGDRVVIAALRCSQGSIDELLSAVQQANRDWRDLLVAAEFAVDIRAHQYWEPDW